MDHFAVRQAAVVIAAAFSLVFAGPVPVFAEERPKIEDITGDWVAKKALGGGEVSIRASGNGLMQLEGRDGKSSFRGACVSYGPIGRCAGHGISTAGGEGFIFESVIRLTKDGDIQETWLARFSEQELSGQTVWTRKK